MKTLVDYINENYNTEKFEFQGKFKKGMEVVMVYGDKWPLYKATNDGYKKITGDTLVEKVKVAEIEKVVSKDLGRYSGDQHTWIYVDSLRFDLYNPKSRGFDARLDLDAKANKSAKDQYILIFTKDTFKELLNKNGEFKCNNDDSYSFKLDFSKIDKKELDEVLK